MRRRLELIRDERGMTLVEMLIAAAAGVVVVAGLSATSIVTLRESNRVTSHVDADQRARMTMTKVTDQLHSACFSYENAPVLKESDGSNLIFTRPTPATLTKVSPTPLKSKISLSGTTLTQYDYAATTSAAPWSYSSTASATTELMTGVNPVSASVPIFRYYAYSSGKVSTTPQAVPLDEANALRTVQVTIAFKASPLKTPLSAASDPNSATAIQNSVLLRFTPSGYESSSEYLPCE